jgi:endoglucanase
VTCRSDRREALQRILGSGGALVSAFLGSPCAAAASSNHPSLRRGINLTHWFEYEQGQVVSIAEMQMLRQLGMDHVRIPVDPVVGGWRPEVSARVNFLTPLRLAVEQALSAGLDVVLDLHLEPATKLQIERNPKAEAALEALWSQVARVFADLPKHRVAFELYNEPQYYGWRAIRWPTLQMRLLNALRAHAPHHLALLSGNEGGSLKGLNQLPLVRDEAVAYVFHYYAPFLFTHQGAHWLDTQYTTAGLHQGVLYPSQFQITKPARLSQSHPRAAQEMLQYLKDDWGPQRVRADMDEAGLFAKTHGVRVLCNEFGAIRANVDIPSRYRWIADVRIALEANDIGWTLWDYTDIFGITAQSNQMNKAGIRTIESEAVRALGMTALSVVR